ncbi:MAG: tyrosine-type recombinase/integrase [Phycisphaeraceae bacterium]
MTATVVRLAHPDRPTEPLKFAFTIKALERVKTTRGRRWVYDAHTPGLALQATPNGHKAFYYAKRIKGRYRKMKLGDFGVITIEQARKLATREAGQISEGKNPADDRRIGRGEMTVNELWTLYQAEHLLPRCSHHTIRAEQYLFDRSLKQLAGRKLSDIAPATLKTLHAKTGVTSRVSANRVIQLLRRLYRYATRHHGYEGRIPTAGVELFREHSRERFLSADELPRFLDACDAEGQPWADFFRLCLLTGARRSNVQAMRWTCIDITARKWTIPGGETKNGRDTAVPLTGPALEILQRRKTEQAESEHERVRTSDFVFPALRDKGDTEHLSQPARPFTRICERAAITGLTIHDLRRTAGAWLAASGASLPMIGKALGHSDLRATQIYARLDLDPVRAAMEGTAATMIASQSQKAVK